MGPFTSLGDRVQVQSSEIEHSIVLEGSRLEHVPQRIDSSLIGRDVVVRAIDTLPRSYRLVLGDSSHVELS